jgi:hypothetical protein
MDINFIKLLKYGAQNGDLDIMQKILNISSNIFSLSTIGFIFNNACWYGHLVMVKWLYEIKPDIDISARNEYAFKLACFNYHLHIAEWLYVLLSLKYYIETFDNHIIDYYIKKIIQIDQTRNIHVNKLTICPIYIESNINIQTNCAHSYWLSCISEWYNRSSKCPMCKQEITYVNNVFYFLP